MKKPFEFSLLLGVFIYLTGCVSAPEFVTDDQLPYIRFKTGVSVTAPDGYCLDRKLVEDQLKASFAILLPCDDIIGTLNPGLFTLTIAPTEETLLSFKALKSVKSEIPQNEWDHKPKMYFRRVEVSDEMRMNGMQGLGWQLIEQDKGHVKILTLHMPEFAKMDEIRAKDRLFVLMKQVRHPLDYYETPDAPADIIRPRIRPVKEYNEVFSIPPSYILRPRMKPDES